MKEQAAALDIKYIRALAVWRVAAGHQWRSKLRNAWATGRYGNIATDTAAVLQELRNNHGDIGLRISNDEMGRRLHHYDLQQAAKALIEKITGGLPMHTTYHAYQQVMKVEGLLQLYPEAYHGTV